MNVDSKVAKWTLDTLDKEIYNHKRMVLSTIYSMYIKKVDPDMTPKEFYNKYSYIFYLYFYFLTFKQSLKNQEKYDLKIFVFRFSS